MPDNPTVAKAQRQERQVEAPRDDVFARHLDLEPLLGRRRGVTFCIFHDDRHPSLSIDRDQGLFNCFACGAKGGLKRFAELVGEQVPSAQGRGKFLEPHILAIRIARNQPWMRPGVVDAYAIADAIRRRLHLADRARRAATAKGDHPETWDVLGLAARLEREAWAIESEAAGFLTLCDGRP